MVRTSVGGAFAVGVEATLWRLPDELCESRDSLGKPIAKICLFRRPMAYHWTAGVTTCLAACFEKASRLLVKDPATSRYGRQMWHSPRTERGHISPMLEPGCSDDLRVFEEARGEAL